MPDEIPFIRPRFPAAGDLAEDFASIVDVNRYTNFGPLEKRFAEALGRYLGPDLHVATFANGTIALMAAIHTTFGLGAQNRYLLMPSFSFIAVAQAALWNGYLPWFIDIDPQTWQPSAEAAAAVLENSRGLVAGIVLPNVFGVGNPTIGEWEKLARDWGLAIVVDSAAGFGSQYGSDEYVGGRGACEIFSFHATKPFSIGEGGALVSGDPAVVEGAYRFQNFGFSGKRESIQHGMNGKLQEINAAIGIRQLVEFDERLANRRSVFRQYREQLTGLGLQYQPNAEISSLCFASLCCVSVEQKASVLASLHREAVEARDYYNPPQDRHPYLLDQPQRCRRADLSVTNDISSRIVSVPIHDDMSQSDIARVIRAIKAGAQHG